MCVVVYKHMGSWPMGSSRWFCSGGFVRPGPATAPASAHGTWRHGRWWRATASGTRCGDGAYIDAECRRSYILDVHPFRIYIYIWIYQELSRYFVLFWVYDCLCQPFLIVWEMLFFSDNVPAGSCRFDVFWMNQSTISAPAKGIGEGSYVGERGRDT